MKSYSKYYRPLGIHSIDEQHEQLLKLIDELLSELSRPLSEKLGGLAADFAAALADHTEHEQLLLEEYGYPGLDKQTRDHVTYLRSVQRMSSKLQQGTPVARDEVERLAVELVDHIYGADQAYAQFLLLKGVR